MPRTITPLDDTISAPEAIPDRSNLSKLYVSPGEKNGSPKSDPKNSEPVAVALTKLGFLDSLVINFLIMVPYIISFLSIIAIYSIGGIPNGIEDALENRINTILLTVPALLPWFISLRVLYNRLWGYRIPFSGLLATYLFFLLPVVQVSIKLHEDGIPSFIYLTATLILSQVFIWLIGFVLKDNKIVLSRVMPLLAFMVILFCLAAFL